MLRIFYNLLTVFTFLILAVPGAALALSAGVCANVGEVCDDGTVYVGLSGGRQVFAARCDHGQVWNGSACTGSRIRGPWKTEETATPGTLSQHNGGLNLVGMEQDGLAEHPAGKACRDLGPNWYLPARDELNLLYTHQNDGGLAGTFSIASGWYWTSTESGAGSSYAAGQRFSDGHQFEISKINSPGGLVRCVRGKFCSNPYGLAGARKWIGGTYKYCDGAAWQDFSLDGGVGSCSAAGQMDWHEPQSAHTICDGTNRKILRYAGDLGACTKKAAIDFDAAVPLYKFCDGARWRPMIADPCGIKAMQAVTNAAAVNTRLAKSTALENTADGPRFTLSVWFKIKEHASNPSTQVLFENYWGRIQIGLYSSSPSAPAYNLGVFGKDSSDTNRATIWAANAVAEGVWYHMLASVDTNLGVGHIYLNNSIPPANIDVSSGGHLFDIATTDYLFHLYGWSNGFQGEVAEFWFDDSYVDLSIEANRHKFISAGDAPVSLGADGSGPTGTQPLIFFSGDASQWGANKGRGGTFTQQGTLQNTVALSSGITSAVGTACFDGTVYAGQSPDGDVPMFTTPGESTEYTMPWGPYGAYRGITGRYTGQANTAALAGHGTWVHTAAYYCDTLSAYGYDDWYLPAVYELVLLRALEGTAAALDGAYWSSTENGYDPEDEHVQNRALLVSMPDGGIDWWRGKEDYRGVRCVRRMATPPADPCAGTPSPGAVCADGSIYAGRTPDGGRPLYITAENAPSHMRWGPTGTNTAMVNCTTSNPGTQTSCTTGEANTVLLAGLGTGYEAATYCHGLSVHGHSDWYLPSQNELQLLYNNLGPSPAYGFVDWYWSSSERANNTAWDMDFSDGEQASSGKQDVDYVRCVRKGG